jgi:ParB family chromosome partitioning protein
MKRDVRQISIEKISPNLRCVYSSTCIDELADSIRSQGQMEPVRLSFVRESFRIMDGEKRWRACKKLGIAQMKAIIMEVEPSLSFSSEF